MSSEDERKKRIMEHIARSKGEFSKRPTSPLSSERRSQVMDHIRRTKG